MQPTIEEAGAAVMPRAAGVKKAYLSDTIDIGSPVLCSRRNDHASRG